jgi:putative nucleotidyltransferase with HDIG domain
VSPLKRLVVGVSIAGFVAIAHSLAALPTTPHVFAWLLMGAFAVIAGSFALKVPNISATLSISDTFFMTSALLFGPAPATITIAVDSLVVGLSRRHPVDRVLFNLSSTAFSLWVAAHTFFALSGSGPLYDTVTPPTAMIMLPLACLAAVYYLLNSGLLATAISLDKNIPTIQLWRRHFTVISLNYFASASAAFVLVILLKYVSPIAVAALAPVLVIFYLAMRSWLGRLDDADKHVAKVNTLYLSTVSALSTAIEAKDGVTSDHIHRVQGYAMGLARALHVTDTTTLQAIEAAALLHDTGKIAIPEHILNKPGRLTASEFETMKSHVDVGADILSAIDFPYPVVPIVEAHHENWDGSGYPRGLRGENIPIGARILSVVDCFDALTSDRPYRPAMKEEDAIAIILERRGTFYDPGVVDMFARVYREIRPDLTARPELQNAMRRIRDVRAAMNPESVPTPAPASEATPAPAPAPTPDSSEELLAFVSLGRLAAGTPTIGDVGALAWGHLRFLFPGASFALFTRDPGRNQIVASYAAGPMADTITGTSIGIGQRVSGWVAANGRSMVNADATLDLERATAKARFALSVPMIADGTIAGVMTLYAPEAFADDQSRRLEIIAPHLATAITSADASTRPRASLHLVAQRA